MLRQVALGAVVVLGVPAFASLALAEPSAPRDWTAITAAATAAMVIIGIVLNTAQNIWLKWHQQADAAAAERRDTETAAAARRAADAAVVTATTVATTASTTAAAVKAEADRLSSKVEIVTTRVEGMGLMLDGKLEAWIKRVEVAAEAAGVLKEKTRQEAIDTAVAGAAAGDVSKAAVAVTKAAESVVKKDPP